MYRIILAVTLAFAMVVGVIGSSPARSLLQEATPTISPTPPPEVCTEPNNWQNEIEVQPSGELDAIVRPLDSETQDLYLVVWTIPPGTCIPYTAPGNQKDGAIVLIVQDGVVEFTAQRFDADSAVKVTWGHTGGGPTELPFGTEQTLSRGDWVTQNDQVWFTLRAIGYEPAVILKAVWATLPDTPEGCSGGCR
jgi:hypothetical protein